MFYGQAQQDKFVLNVLKEKRNGSFLEIGSNHPIHINNTFLLERQYDWRGILVEFNPAFIPLYKRHRPKSMYLIQDATQVNYQNLFQQLQMPSSLDYLQIDLEANNGSTLRTLQKLDAELMEHYQFATVTFEHDIYHTNYNNTRLASREIFHQRGYVCVFSDVNNESNPYEDWYVHPDLVDMEYIRRLIETNLDNYKDHPITGKTIDWKDIVYPSRI